MPAGGRKYKVSGRSSRSDNRNGIPNPFNPMDPDHRPKQTTTTTTPKRVKITGPVLSRAGAIRVRSVASSSTSRQRSHKRGPANRGKRKSS